MPIKNLFGLTQLAKPLTTEEGRRILERDQYRCQYCGLDAMSSFENSLIMTVDFIHPRRRLKERRIQENLVTACRPCNVIKGYKVFGSFADAKAYVLEQPRRTPQRVGDPKKRSSDSPDPHRPRSSAGCIGRGRRVSYNAAMNATNDRRIDYIEFPATDLEKTKLFYYTVFGWKFEDYGPEYASFHDGRLSGGFRKEKKIKSTGPLIVLYSSDLEALQRRIILADGKITKPTFEFPGGRRFHFSDPNGNELAVWSNVG